MTDSNDHAPGDGVSPSDGVDPADVSASPQAEGDAPDTRAIPVVDDGSGTAERPVVRVEPAAQDAAGASPLVAAMRAATSRGQGEPDAEGEEPEVAPKKKRRKGLIAGLVALVTVLALAGAYVAAYFVADDKIARGTSVAGVDIGGQTRAEAVDTLNSAFADRAERPIEITVADSDITAELNPTDVGFTFDAEASVDDLEAVRSWSPKRLWDYFAGGEDHDGVITADDAALDEFLGSLEEQAGEPPVEGAVSFEGGEVSTTTPSPGQGFEDEVALEELQQAFLSDDASAELELTDVSPTIDQAALDAAVAEFADPAMSGPVTLVFGETPVALQPAEFAPALSMVREGDALVGQVDGDALRDILDDRVGDPGRPEDASFTIENGEPVVVPAQPGVDYLPETLAEVFEGLVVAPEGSREASIEAEAAEPDFTTEDAEALGVVEEVSEFSTQYPHAEYRNVNIGRAAELVNGTLLKPGEEFSLNGIVGERTEANGFTAGYIIANGVFRNELGGGVSQMATTTYNAAYFAGLRDIEHKPHSLYIDRYPEGREATVAWPNVDLQFENDTEYGVYIQTIHSPSSPGSSGTITVKMFSTKIWDIESDVSGRYNYTSSETRTSSDSDCEPQSGSSGFSVDYDRVFRRAGESEVVKREELSWTYSATPTVRCVDPTPAPEAPEQSPPDEEDPPPADEDPPPADPEG